MDGVPIIVRGEGVHVFDSAGRCYLDWTSQAVCANLGHSLPSAVTDAVVDQMRRVSHVYGGLGMVEVRARLSALMAEVMPGDLVPDRDFDPPDCHVRTERTPHQ